MEVVTCPGCLERDKRIAALERRVADLETLVRDLLDRLGTNATNSATPPSANPPQAPKPVTKKRTGKAPGGQPGHPAHLRCRLPLERLHKVVPFVPSHCLRCAEPLPPNPSPFDPEPSWHQVAELPKMAARVTEYQGHYRTCPRCGQLNHAPIANDDKAHSIGPRLAATLAYLAGSHHVSKRGLEEICADVFDVPVSLGTIAHLETQMSEALAQPHNEAVQAVRAAEVKNVDETSWKVAGKLCWLWLAATQTVAVFLIHARRGLEALQALLGASIAGWVGSDRWSAYAALPAWQRQICWAHLRRDFQKLIDRGGAAKRLGQKLQRITARVFEEWHLFRGGTIRRGELALRLDPDIGVLHRVLQSGCRCADSKAAQFCANLLDIEVGLWQFVAEEGIEPTNNHAERLLRRGVLWRKNAFGCHSEGGCRFVERLLTVVQTRRLQGRGVLSYLHAALVAHRSGRPAPSLLPVG
jgi:transposase